MQNNFLLDPVKFKIEQAIEDEDKNAKCCKKLIENWTPQLEKETLEEFIHLYYDKMYKQWGPDDEEKSKMYWLEIRTPEDLVKYTGTDITLYALEDAIYAKSKTESSTYESRNIPLCVVLVLACPWDEDCGWAAVFVDEKLVKVDRDIVDCVWLD